MQNKDMQIPMHVSFFHDVYHKNNGGRNGGGARYLLIELKLSLKILRTTRKVFHILHFFWRRNINKRHGTIPIKISRHT